MKIDNRTLSHNFASGYNDSDTAGNMFWEWADGGRVVYSYGHHFPIARILPGGVMLFTSESYSNTTGHHKSYILSACSHFKIIYCKDVTSYGQNANFKAWLNDFAELEKHLATARKPEIYLLKISELIENVSNYCAAVSVKLPRKFTRFLDYKESATRSERIRKHIAALAKKEKAKAAKAAKEEQKAVKEWTQGKRAYISVTATKGRQILRVIAHKGYKVIETSKGVKFTLHQARELAPRLDDLKVYEMILDRFRVRENSANVLRIGCHTFDKKYLKQFAAINL